MEDRVGEKVQDSDRKGIRREKQVTFSWVLKNYSRVKRKNEGITT